MSYQDLIGDKVYWGSYGYEHLHTITDIEEENDIVVIYMDTHYFTKIQKEDLGKFIENGYVEFIRKFSDGPAFEVLMTVT